MPAQPVPERREAWRAEQHRRQTHRFVTGKGPRPPQKPKEKK